METIGRFLRVQVDPVGCLGSLLLLCSFEEVPLRIVQSTPWVV